MKMKKLASLFLALALVATLGFTVGCSGSKTLTISVSDDGRAWSFIDQSTKETISYTTLRIDGQKAIDVSVMQSPMGDDGIYIAFTEDQKPVVSGGSTSWSGGMALFTNGSWKYTLEDGVLDITL